MADSATTKAGTSCPHRAVESGSRSFRSDPEHSRQRPYMIEKEHPRSECAAYALFLRCALRCLASSESFSRAFALLGRRPPAFCLAASFFPLAFLLAIVPLFWR